MQCSLTGSVPAGSVSEGQSGAGRSITLDHVVDAPLRLHDRVISPCPVQPCGLGVPGLCRRGGPGLCPIAQLAGRFGLGQTIGAAGPVSSVWIPSRLVLEYHARALRLRHAVAPIHPRTQSTDQVVPRVLDRRHGDRPNLRSICVGCGGRRDARHSLDRDRPRGRGRARRRTDRRARNRQQRIGDGWKTPGRSGLDSTDDDRPIAGWRSDGRRRAGGCGWIDGQGRAGNDCREDRGQSAGLRDIPQADAENGAASFETCATAAPGKSGELAFGNREFDAPLIECVVGRQPGCRDREAPRRNESNEARRCRPQEPVELLEEQRKLDTPLVQGIGGRPRGRNLAHGRTVGERRPVSHRTTGGLFERRRYCRHLTPAGDRRGPGRGPPHSGEPLRPRATDDTGASPANRLPLGRCARRHSRRPNPVRFANARHRPAP
jgi:hypothetical protein